MRRRILGVALRSVLIAVLLLGLPLALVLDRLTVGRAQAQLEALALRSAVFVPQKAGDPPELPAVSPGQEVAVYDVHGRRTAGVGPDQLDAPSLAALGGRPTTTTIDGDIVAVVPVSADERVYALVRAATEQPRVQQQVWMQWGLLAGGCLAAGLGAAAFAARASRRLATPVAALARMAEQIGEGDFTPRNSPSGVVELDTAASALSATAHRLGELIERERSFSRTASHQLRTPLTQLQLELEAGLEAGGRELEQAASTALESIEQLSQTIDDVLALPQTRAAAAPFDIVALVRASADEWRGPLAAEARPLAVRAPATLDVAASPAAVRQILHVLLDNAFRHGKGAVTLAVRETLDVVAVDVTDEGDSPPHRWGQASLGLSLARTLAEADGGRLYAAAANGLTSVTVLLPGAPP
ncbi:HAMP domain-containing sensor histidine kinase [Nocardioides ginsengisoli]|uniref:histidine kinase n=1 Tax=Nocardioides ginsengisoli TaxID=363868 RepID=A0ABW3VUG8_9ACTN